MSLFALRMGGLVAHERSCVAILLKGSRVLRRHPVAQSSIPSVAPCSCPTCLPHIFFVLQFRSAMERVLRHPDSEDSPTVKGDGEGDGEGEEDSSYREAEEEEDCRLISGGAEEDEEEEMRRNDALLADMAQSLD